MLRGDRIYDKFEEKRTPIGGNIGEEYLLFDENFSDSESIRLDESGRLDEMAIRDISRDSNLPFKICIKDPETTHKDDPHAHLFESGRNGKDLGMRLELYPEIPRSLIDIRDAFPGGGYEPVPDEWKPLILAWGRKPNKTLPETSNWRNLWSQWVYSVNR
jgi:hypothetical protein